MTLITRSLLLFIALNGALATGLAAFASHHPLLAQQSYLLEVFNKANAQHYIHTVACLGAVLGAVITTSRWWLIAAGLFATGITLFSYTLYLFAFTGVKIAGFLTPIGGVCFILGWLSLSIAAWQIRLPVQLVRKINE